MRIPSQLGYSTLRAKSSRERALTLSEMMVAMAVFSILSLGFVQVHLFGLRYDQVVGSKLGASDESRIALAKLTSEIRAAKQFRVGHGSQTTFVGVPDGQPQLGSALQVNPATSTNVYIRYYLDENSQELRRMENGDEGYDVIARSLTNTVGITLNEANENQVVGVQLHFYQYQYPLTQVGPGYLYDYYKLDFKVTRRSFD